MVSSDSSDGAWPPDGEPQRSRRMPLRRKVSLKFKEFQGFVNEYSENVSTGGMFIRTPSPQPPGTVFDFEFTLSDGYTLIHGIGEVVWVREEDAGFDQPAGMGVRFLSLDPESRKLIDRMVEQRLDRAAGRASEPNPTLPWGTPAAPGLEGVEPPEESLPDVPWPREEEPAVAPASEAGEPRPSPPLWRDDLGDEPVEAPPEPERQPVGPSGPSPYAYARSYQGSGIARPERKRRPLLMVLLGIALLVAALAAFFLFFPEAAVRLLVGGGSGDEARLVEVERPRRTGGVPGGAPVAPVPRAEAEGVLEPAPGADAQDTPAEAPAESPAPPPGADEAGAAEEAERELGFFTPVPRPPARERPAPEEPTPPEAPAEAPEPRPPSSFSRVLNIVWEDLGDELLVTVHLDGAIQEWDYSTVRVGGAPPRELVRIEGVERAFPRPSIEVGSGLLERIRVGFHPGPRESQLHVVLDLATPDVELDRSEAEGSELRLYLVRQDG